MGFRGLAANPRLSRPGARGLSAGALFDALRLADIHQNLARNIVSLRQSQDLFDDLSPNPQDWNVAIRHELATRPKPYTSDSPAINRPFEEAIWIEAVAYPFQPPNWSTSRFSDGSFGIWYGADSIETTVHETAWHWRNGLLADAGFDREGVRIERKVVWVRGDAALVDFRPEIKRMPELVHPTSYAATQPIGKRLHREGFPGLVSRSARCDGHIFGILNPGVLSNPVQACWLSYRLESGRVAVEKETGVDWLEA
ncbi:MAG: hypothetical protein B7Y50_07410 [Hydrogenophilales bacterium 28-61-11]|nr:MAG: hypothetical protein B7Y50_07410 [Hydrogenophilales bacterium 28-61-11]OYZ56038.1 MAG: hypothetical protein B7Y21_12975 [Hydrogenophilales bacterium 16-61-112]